MPRQPWLPAVSLRRRVSMTRCGYWRGEISILSEMDMKTNLKILRYEDLADRVAVVVGTRPGIIKMSPIIRELGRCGMDHVVIHTGQHYSHEMNQAFFSDLELSQPDYYLDSVSGCHYHGEQTAEMLKGVEQALLEAKPKVVLVCGDANTNLAAGLAARKLRMALGHVEAGLRSYDWTMPEEHNRVILDHISELLFAPTAAAARHLEEDHVRGRIHVTGNTIVDAVQQNLEIARAKSDVMARFALEPGGYFVCTAHREENVDVQERLLSIVSALHLVGQELGFPILFPVHPRTRNRLAGFDGEKPLRGVGGLQLIEPLGYLDFLLLLAHARLTLTDSGGIQEESCILKVPCVTLRDNTERQETVEIGANRVAGVESSGVLAAARAMLGSPCTWPNPFGDGTAAEQIVRTSRQALENPAGLLDTHSRSDASFGADHRDSMSRYLGS